MPEKEWVIRGIPAWVLKEYLEKLGGSEASDNEFSGPGWQAQLTRLPDENRHGMVFQCFRVTIRGEAEVIEPVWRAFELKILRPGG